MKNESIQHSQLASYQNKILFEQAKKFAFEYLDTFQNRNVYPTEKALSDLAKFDQSLPELSSDPSDTLQMLHEYGSPATVTNMGGRYYGFVTGGVVPIGLAAKWLSDCWDQNSALHVLSPITSKLEEVAEKWLKDILGLPSNAVAGFVSGTSSATFCGLAAARFSLCQKQGWDWQENGMYGAPKLRVITSLQTHSTVTKALNLLGFGKGIVEWIEVDDQGRIRADRLPKLDERSIVILQAGNVNSGSFDDFNTICDKAISAGSWVHIDGAFGLWAAASHKLSHLTKGIEKANSWSVDGHKTLNTPYDCGIIMCKDADAIVSALHMSSSYIVNSVQRDGMYYTPEMSRRARVVELWAIMKYLGRAGIADMIYTMHQRAIQFAEELRKAYFTIHNDVVFNQVLVSCESDELTLDTLKNIQELRVCWCGPSEWFGRKVIRISICSWVTSESDVTRSVASFIKARAISKSIKK